MSWFKESERHAKASMGVKTVVVDLDGTVFNPKFRESIAQKRAGTKYSDEYYDELDNPNLVKTDRPIRNAKEILDDLAKDHKIIYTSERPEKLRESTRKALNKHDLPKGTLKLRPEGQTTKEHKIGVVKDINNPVLVIGDQYSDELSARKNKVKFAKVKSNKPWNKDKIMNKLEG